MRSEALFDHNLRFEIGLHFGPFRSDHAEVDRIPHTPCPGDDVLAEDSFLLRSDAQNRVPRLRVEEVGFEFDAIAAERFKGMAHHQVFCFRVNRGALPRFRDPGCPDLDALVRHVDIHVARRADGSARGFIDGGKWERRPLVPIGEGAEDIAHHLIPIEDLERNPFPQLRIEADGTQGFVMGFGKRLQADVRAFERDRL